jgi:hypothetical protein
VIGYSTSQVGEWKLEVNTSEKKVYTMWNGSSPESCDVEDFFCYMMRNRSEFEGEATQVWDWTISHITKVLKSRGERLRSKSHPQQNARPGYQSPARVKGEISILRPHAGIDPKPAVRVRDEEPEDQFFRCQIKQNSARKSVIMFPGVSLLIMSWVGHVTVTGLN